MPTDIQESNILLGMNEETAERDLDDFEKNELTSPSSRKIDGDRVIYTSRRLVPPPSMVTASQCFVTLARRGLENMTTW